MADPGGLATRLLEHEARGLLTRLDQVRPFALHETMVPAAALPYDAQLIIERFLHASRGRLREKVHGYLDWLHGQGRQAGAAEQQRRFVLIRLGFNDVLSEFDLFTEVITQRSEHETGVWLSGLDVLARGRAPGRSRRLRAGAGRVLPGPGTWRRDPSGPHALARRRVEPGRDHRGPQGTHGGQRHRKLTGARSGASGSCATGAGGVVARRPRPGGGQGPAGLLADVGQVDQ